MEKVINEFFAGLYKVLDYPIFRMGDSRLTLSMLLTLLLLFGVVIVVERLLRRLFFLRLLKKTQLEPPLQFALGRILGYFVLLIGFYIAFEMVGINLSSLAVVAGAVGVGLGFGLQNILNNFVSGLIILAERHISIGDRIEVSGVDGEVVKISLRSTTVLTSDNIAIVVPNSDLIAHAVTNWSYGDHKVRFRVPLGVAYGTDLATLRRLLLQVANDHPHVLKNPPPDVFCTGFGDSAINVELVVWSEQASKGPRKFRSDLWFAMEKILRENQIEIPFPQRDLHLRSGSLPPAANAERSQPADSS
jgi:small-conductance mechanosensitive channel